MALTPEQIKHRTIGSIRVVKLLRDYGESLDRESLNLFASNEIKNWSLVHCLQWLSGARAYECLSVLMQDPSEIQNSLKISPLAALDLLHLASMICSELHLSNGLNLERLEQFLAEANPRAC